MMRREYLRALMFTVILAGVTAILDIWSMNSGVFGTPANYVAGNYSPGWWPLFFKINLLFSVVTSLFYYFVIRKDKSETIGIFITTIGVFFSGLPDILFFLFQGQNVPALLPWLNGSPFISFVARLLGQTSVTSVTLIFSVAISLVSLGWLDKLLEKIR